jgi:hypothetical protein
MSVNLNAWSLAGCLTMASCVPDFDTDLSQLTEPRLIAISSWPAEARPMQPVTLTALVATPEGEQAPEVQWTMCLARKPLTELGPVDPSCLSPEEGDEDVLDLGMGTEATATLDRDVCKLFGPLRPSPMGGEGAGRPADPDATGGFYQPLAARLGGAVSLGAVRIDCDLANVDRDDSVEYRSRYRINENPQIARITRATEGDVELDPEGVFELRAGTSVRLRASWDECSDESTCGDGLCTAFEDTASCAEDCMTEPRGCTGAEPYAWYNRETQRVEARREGVAVAWYASRGRFENEQTGLDESQSAGVTFTENTYIAGTEGSATIWLVIRDTRGGQSWQTRRVQISPP